jgi:Mor family transcriptional regulator
MSLNRDNRMEGKRNELLTDLADLVQRRLLEHDVPANAATLIASALMDHLADHWGGQNISFPKDYRWKLARLELEIYDKFHGNNYDTLALAYGISDRGMRKLIKRVSDKIANGSQCGLFDPPAPA